FQEDRLLVGKIRIERALRKSGRVGDIAHGGLRKPLLDDLLARPSDTLIYKYRLLSENRYHLVSENQSIFVDSGAQSVAQA
ncbi:hypothetical protein, partial [Bradyrhizobium uaiense]|uniref:hypothetical protein n=1 Tax=Bradyrhizobium uaiense TaxID=2594946 RepID=UPI003D31DAB9